SGRRPDLRREVRQRGEIVAEDSGGAGEPVAGELHPIARITGEPDDDPLLLLDGFGHGSLRFGWGAPSMVPRGERGNRFSRRSAVWRYRHDDGKEHGCARRSWASR